MPYKRKSGKWERARSLGHVSIIENEVVQEKLRRYKVIDNDAEFDLPNDLILTREEVGEPNRQVHWAMSFDGSSGEVAVRERYPSTRMCYAQIAGVLVDLAKISEQSRAHLVDPAAVEDASDEALFPVVLPGSNVCDPDMPTVRDSWRAEIYDTFRNYKIENLPLLSVLMLLIGLRDEEKKGPNGEAKLARCPNPECSGREILVPSEGCECESCGVQLYPTDALRIHEEVAELQSNLTALTRLMLVLEHISLVSYLYFLYKRQPRTLKNVAFILDGPLALYGPPSWLHTPIQRFINELHAKLEANNYRPPLIVGLEKSGTFAEHAAAISERIPAGSLMRLPQEYINDRILATRATSETGYGEDNFYGKRFFYKTKTGSLLTFMAPLTTEGGDLSDPANYPNMPEILSLLDEIGTALYEDAVIPVALAHSFASIPLRTGSKVLKLLAENHLSEA